jgi:hypothetical protein
MERKMPDEQIRIYIAVNSVKEYAKKVEELGGKVIKPRLRFLAVAGLQCAWTQRITFLLQGRLIQIPNRDKYATHSTITLNMFNSLPKILWSVLL